MDIRTPKLTQIIMTGLGLLMFVLAMALNHMHPRNQGIADITHGSIYKRFGINETSGTTASFSYVSTLANISTNSKPKIDDPTSPKSDQALPTQAMADGQPDPIQADQNTDKTHSDITPAPDNNQTKKPSSETH
jgi:hypothetical protein